MWHGRGIYSTQCHQLEKNITIFNSNTHCLTNLLLTEGLYMPTSKLKLLLAHRCLDALPHQLWLIRKTMEIRSGQVCQNAYETYRTRSFAPDPSRGLSCGTLASPSSSFPAAFSLPASVMRYQQTDGTGPQCAWLDSRHDWLRGLQRGKGVIVIQHNNNNHLWPSYRSTCISWHLQLKTGGFCWWKVLLPTCPYWQQPVHSDNGEEAGAGVLLNSVIYTVSILCYNCLLYTSPIPRD